MIRLRLLLAATVAVLALPAVAQAGLATAITRDVPLRDGAARGTRSLAATSPARFDLVGVRWRGSGSVEIRVRSIAGRWSGWLAAAPEGEDAPDLGSSESRRSGWHLGNPRWVGPSNAIRYRVHGKVSALRATFVRSPVSRVPLRRPAASVSPAIVPRASWGADESIRRADPEVAPSIRLAIVHHTAGVNGYTQAEAAAIVRGIEVYHVKSNGWNDIGYNFLVDRFGTVYEGRYGGIEQNVIGAHAQGFNTGSVGIAVLGTYEDGGISPAAEKALSELVSWRLDLAHVDPVSTLGYISNGNPRFPAGLPVFLRAVSGHRDTGQTSCPGTTLYAHLDALAAAAQAVGLPKLYEPLVEGSVGGPVRFRARLSDSRAWAVHVVDTTTQTEVATGNGVGASVDWTWDAALAPPGSYAWRIDGDPTFLPASGTLAGSPTTADLAIADAAADLDAITPNGDGQADATTVTYTLSRNANVRADILDSAGVPMVELDPSRWRRAGGHALAFDGRDLPDGAYTIRLAARTDASAEVTADVSVSVLRTLAALAVEPAVFAPTVPDRPRSLGVTFALAQPARVSVRILRDGRWVATPFSGLLTDGPQRVEWDGTKKVGSPADGSYEVVVESVDPIGRMTLSAPFVRDTTAPAVRVVSRRPAVLAFTEAARVSGLANNARSAFTVRGPGKVRIPRIREIATLRLFVRDAAGNLATLRLDRASPPAT